MFCIEQKLGFLYPVPTLFKLTVYHFRQMFMLEKIFSFVPWSKLLPAEITNQRNISFQHFCLRTSNKAPWPNIQSNILWCKYEIAKNKTHNFSSAQTKISRPRVTQHYNYGNANTTIIYVGFRILCESNFGRFEPFYSIHCVRSKVISITFSNHVVTKYFGGANKCTLIEVVLRRDFVFFHSIRVNN